MTRTLISFRSILMSLILLSQLFLGACAEHNTYRAYDGYYHDHHDWDDREQSYYIQWENESHRDHHDYKKRSSNDQDDYWKWRHSHEDKENGHDSH
jgi:hypothetical protein